MTMDILSEGFALNEQQWKGKRHFVSAGNKSTLFAGERISEDQISNVTSNISNFRQSVKYGDWWTGVNTRTKGLDDVTQPANEFLNKYGLKTFSNSSQCGKMTEIAGFGLSRNERESVTEQDNSEVANKNYEDQQECIESEFSNSKIGQNNENNNLEETSDSPNFGGHDLMMEAEARALMRKKESDQYISENMNNEYKNDISKQYSTGVDTPNNAFFRKRTNNSLGLNNSHLSQKQLLEQHMTRRTMSYISRPPWHTSFDEFENNGRVQSNGLHSFNVSNGSKNSSNSAQLTTSQIDFPCYSTKEIQASKQPIANSGRGERCTWLPNIAAMNNITKEKLDLGRASDSERGFRNPLRSYGESIIGNTRSNNNSRGSLPMARPSHASFE